jgi:hypothetical protein
MRTTRTTNRPGRTRSWLRSHRRGVVSVLSMMFVIIFGSLGAAMAIMSRSNLQTAATHQHVMRAMGAAETGLAVAHQRLAEATGRFMVETGTIDGDFGRRLWSGTLSSSEYGVLYSPSYPSNSLPDGVATALLEAHAQDLGILVDPQTGGISRPVIGPAPTGTDAGEYRLEDWVRTPAVAVSEQVGTQPRGLAFQIEYAPLANGTDVRVFVTGYDFDYRNRGRAVTRRIVQDFSIVKRVHAAVVSPSKIMIGKNVMVEGDLGAVYTDVGFEKGDPLIMKSDFWGIEPAFDAELTKLYEALVLYDVDKDNRLRLAHPIERQGIESLQYSSLGYTGAAIDVTGDGYVDEFDVFIMFYDRDRDGQVVLSSELTQGTPAEGRTPEFEADDQLARLIDSARPDRNNNGVSGFEDVNSNGVFDPGVDVLLDVEEVDPLAVPAALQSYIRYISGQAVLYRDQVLGYRDGVIDKRDQYAKVTGRVVFRITEAQWIAGQGPNYMERVQGPIRNNYGGSPVQFGAPNSAVPDLSASSFTNSQTALRAAANGPSFDEQVALNLGVPVSALATWSPANNPTGVNDPKFRPLLPDSDFDALPDNWQTAHFEKMPFNSPASYDWYYRPVYENMTFRNVQIPMGNNGLFINCTFIGVTYVRCYTANTHPNWPIYGRLAMDYELGRPVPSPLRPIYRGTSYPQMLDAGDRPVLMADPPVDRADIPHDQVGAISNYTSLSSPLIINNRRVIDTKLWSNSIRFHDCLFVGSVVGDAPAAFMHSRNKLQFTGATRFAMQHTEYPSDPSFNPDPGALEEIRKSSLMMPNYSVDIGQFNSPRTQDVRLQGAIVAGVLDVRGNATIDGALLLTYRPVVGEVPLLNGANQPIGNPSLFNASLGYFGPADGDDESLDPLTLPFYNGERIVGWDLDGDGLPDLGAHETPTAAQLTAGAVPVPFHGYGRITLRFDPAMGIPDGIILPLQVQPLASTYKETSK